MALDPVTDVQFQYQSISGCEIDKQIDEVAENGAGLLEHDCAVLERGDGLPLPFGQFYGFRELAQRLLIVAATAPAAIRARKRSVSPLTA